MNMVSWRYDKKVKDTRHELIGGDFLTDEEYKFFIRQKEKGFAKIPLHILIIKILYVLATKHNIKIGI